MSMVDVSCCIFSFFGLGFVFGGILDVFTAWTSGSAEEIFKRSLFKRRKGNLALLLRRLKVAIQNTVCQLVMPGKHGSHRSPVATKGTLMTTFSATPTFSRTSFIVFLKHRMRSLKRLMRSFWVASLFGGRTLLANVRATTACSHSWVPNVAVNVSTVLMSSLRNRRLFISVQKMNTSQGSVTLSLIFRRYSSSFPVSSASPGVSNTVIWTSFMVKW